MANPQVLEGTWEELKLHEKELSGKRFRLVPLASESCKSTLKQVNPRRLRFKNQGPRHHANLRVWESSPG